MFPTVTSTRRQFLQQTTRNAVGLGIGSAVSADLLASKLDRPHFGLIGVGGRGRSLMQQAMRLGDVVAVCDVDTHRAEAGREATSRKALAVGDYRRLLDEKNIDAVIIATPDHWHTKIAIEAMLAGKDVYCEKPLTLAIDEGKLICQAVQKTQRVFQVGTQQRSEFNGRFLQAVAMVRDGRIGKLKRVTASTGGGKTGGPFQESEPPKHLDWNQWLGQAPLVPYTPERCHGSFRWWREYAGGQMTDWGAHHVDIALWAIGLPSTGIVRLSGKGDVPQIRNGFNMPAQFDVQCQLPNGIPLRLVTGQRQGILFEGETGRFFVNRGGIYGTPVDQLADAPLPDDALSHLYKGKQPGSHMGNFVQCMMERDEPVSDVFSHHRVVSILHLANLCLLLRRTIQWDLEAEQIVGDDEAQSHQRRAQRQGFEIPAVSKT